MDYKEFLKAVQDKTLRLSFSGLSRLEKSPRHFVEFHTNPTAPTPAMTYGSLVHCLVLEPETFAQRYAIAPICDKRTKAGKQAWDSFVQSSQGLQVITQQQHYTAVNSIEGLKNCKPAMGLLRRATEIEQKIRFDYKGLTISGIRDLSTPDYVCDLKTTTDASPKSFRYSVYKYFYHLQAAIYTYECQRPYYIIALEKNGNCAVYEIGQNLIEQGRELFERLVTKYKRCTFLDAWEQSYGFDQADGVYLID